MNHHIFLSYSRKDSAFMHRVNKDLRRAGFLVWTDEGIEPGTSSWQRAIEEAIINSGCIVCILSPDSAQSPWVREELNFARLHNKEVFLLMARGDERVSVPFGYSLAQWVDIRTRKAYRDSMIQLIKTLRTHLGKFNDISQSKRLPDLSEDFQLAATGPLIEEPPVMTGILPKPFDWCEIPAGEVTIDNYNYPVERFYISKYPITNAQFQVFIEDEHGYKNPGWYDFSEAAQLWRRENYARNPLHKDDDLPRTYVSWFEAIAYSRWLQDKTGSSFILMLPTESQWQRAAQGDDDRLYPWGNEYEKRRCNIFKSGIGQPTSVLSYPSGASPYGVFDMCGNVDEWCLTDWDGHAHLERNANRVLRGGSYDSGRTMAQVTMRNYQEPGIRTHAVGFRLCANLPMNT